MTKQENSYSLWLRPVQTQIDELTKIISRLAHRYHTAPFPPHITLLPSITAPTDTIKKTCGQIIERHQAFDIRLKKIACTQEYYRNLYILAETETTLIKLYEDAKTLLKHENNECFMPHVSLLYGKLEIEKQKILKAELKSSISKVFSCQRLDIYNTTGKESEWQLIESYNLA